MKASEPPPEPASPDWASSRLHTCHDAACELLADDTNDLTDAGMLAALIAADRRVAESMAARVDMLAGLAARARQRAEASEEADAAAGDVSRLAAFPLAKREELERRSMVAEVACALRIPEGTIIHQISDAETLTAELPETLAALRGGAVNYRHAQVMVAHADTLPPEDRAGFEGQVLPEALALTAAQFDGRARKIRERLHPESILVRSVAARAERCVRFEAARDGMAYLHHFLPAVDAQRIDETLSRCARAARGPGESRTITQLRSDALTDLILRRGAAMAAVPGNPEGASEGVAAGVIESDATELKGSGDANGSVHPTVIVTVPISTLLGSTDEPGELAGYGPIDADTARKLAANAPSLLRMITDPVTGEVLSLGRRRYRPPRNLQLVLQLDDETCRFPACNRRAANCEIDHTRAWEEGGTTDPENLAHLCRKHHHLKHQPGTRWRVRQLDGRGIEWVSPCGCVYTTAPTGKAVTGAGRSNSVRDDIDTESGPVPDGVRSGLRPMPF